MRASVLAALALGSSIAPLAAAQETSRPAVQFKAFCTFEREQSDLSLWEEGTARDELRRHAYAHGWSWELTAPDLVSGANAARCPDRILQQMAQANALSDVFLYHDIALALERNNRLDSALDFLRRGLEENQTKEPGLISGMHSAFISEWAAKLAAHSSDWARALEFAGGWYSTSTCGNAASGELHEIIAFKARCLSASGRFEEAIALARKGAVSLWARPRNVPLIELWLDCEIRLGQAKTIDDALKSVLSEVSDDAFDDCIRAREAWKLAHAPRPTQLAHLSELANFHPDLAMTLLLTLDEQEMTSQINSLDFGNSSVRDSELTRLLVELGLPEIGVKLKGIDVFAREYLFDMWTGANSRWKLLTEGG